MKSAASDKSRWAAALPTSSGLPSDSWDTKTSMKIIVALFAMKGLKHIFVDTSFDRAEKCHQLTSKTLSKPYKTYGKTEKKKHELHLYTVITKKLSFLHLLVALFPHSAKKHLFSDTGTSICWPARLQRFLLLERKKKSRMGSWLTVNLFHFFNRLDPYVAGRNTNHTARNRTWGFWQWFRPPKRFLKNPSPTR